MDVAANIRRHTSFRTTPRVILASQTTLRALVLVWYSMLAFVRLGYRLLMAQFARRTDAQARIVGQTLVELFTSLGPTYIKLGQILSTRRDLLGEPLIEELERLQDCLPPIPFRAVSTYFRKELHAELNMLFAEFGHQPVASASVASVYRGRLRDGRVVAIKVKRPGIEGLIESDLRVLRAGAGLLHHLPMLRYIPLRLAVSEFGLSLERQLDFRMEAAANSRLRAALGRETHVLVPALIEELCSSSILTMDFVEGLHGAPERGNAAAREGVLAALRALYQMIFLEGFVHCDLHHGNLHLLPDGRAVLIDFGFMAELETADRVKFAEFFYAMATNNGKRCAQIVQETALFLPASLNHARFMAEVIALVSSVAATKAREFQVAKFVLSLFDIQRRHRIVGTTAFTMAILSLLTFEGVAKEVYPDLDFQREAIPFVLRASLPDACRTPAGRQPDAGRTPAVI